MIRFIRVVKVSRCGCGFVRCLMSLFVVFFVGGVVLVIIVILFMFIEIGYSWLSFEVV